jgi:hypothetical protein
MTESAALTNDNTSLIAELNDTLRRDPLNSSKGQFVLSHAVANLNHQDRYYCIRAMVRFNDFTPGNDPYGERDFGAFSVRLSDGTTERLNFKIDYYDPSMKFLSEDPSNSNITRRVLTLMFASDY